MFSVLSRPTSLPVLYHEETAVAFAEHGLVDVSDFREGTDHRDVGLYDVTYRLCTAGGVDRGDQRRPGDDTNKMRIVHDWEIILAGLIDQLDTARCRASGESVAKSRLITSSTSISRDGDFVPWIFGNAFQARDAADRQ
jgi:hypothetical protein